MVSHIRSPVCGIIIHTIIPMWYHHTHNHLYVVCEVTLDSKYLCKPCYVILLLRFMWENKVWAMTGSISEGNVMEVADMQAPWASHFPSSTRYNNQHIAFLMNSSSLQGPWSIRNVQLEIFPLNNFTVYTKSSILGTSYTKSPGYGIVKHIITCIWCHHKKLYTIYHLL